MNVIDVSPPHAPKQCVIPTGVSAPIHYFVLDLCEGGDLFGYISTQPLEAGPGLHPPNPNPYP